MKDVEGQMDRQVDSPLPEDGSSLVCRNEGNINQNLKVIVHGPYITGSG
jgi:hypothetical protein